MRFAAAFAPGPAGQPRPRWQGGLSVFSLLNGPRPALLGYSTHGVDTLRSISPPPSWPGDPVAWEEVESALLLARLERRRGLAVPFSAVGAVWLLWLLDYNVSIAVWVGIIALMGLDAETGVFMLLFLDLSHDEAQREGRLRNERDLIEAIVHGAVKRVRPSSMPILVMMTTSSRRPRCCSHLPMTLSDSPPDRPGAQAE